ncbi:MAG TPA: thiamine pyrophosphate-requiring protein [Xanthobacteraceae bacterium]|nr:thiamine pyrophosphate-requiring protein [Xanthobacteraceae bacterium]
METTAARKIDQPTNSPTYSTAYFFLEGISELGIEYLFCNFGTDHAPIIEEIAHRRKRGDALPTIITCPHENTAAHMAAGYAFVTGRGQGVLVHVDVGTANTATAMHNIFRSRLPVLLMAGKAPYTTSNELVGSRDTYVHFVQEPFDQASLVRPYLKWEWTLPSGVVVKEALRRAHSIMQSEPRGPVYLMMQRETLTQPWRVDEVRRFGAEQNGSTAAGGADPKLVAQLVDRLMTAESPILITGYAGRNPRASELIAELAELAGIAVFESNMTNNISHESPCFIGFQPDRHLPKADVGLLVDVDVPWFPSDVQANENTFWAHIDVDVLKPASPMWTFPGNLRMQGDSARILEQVLDDLKERATSRFTQAAQARVARLGAERDARLERASKLAVDQGKRDEINPHYLCAELDKLLEPNDIVFNEGVRNAGAALMQIRRPVPGTIMRAGGGGLGWSGAMALGAKLAAPERMMVQIVGDGSFYFGSPCSVFAVAQHHKLPILAIVLDNSGWSAVKSSTLRVFPDGEAKAANEFQAELMPNVEFGKIGEAFGAYAEKVSDPADVPAALARCVKEVRGGRSAILHARVTRL